MTDAAQICREIELVINDRFMDVWGAVFDRILRDTSTSLSRRHDVWSVVCAGAEAALADVDTLVDAATYALAHHLPRRRRPEPWRSVAAVAEDAAELVVWQSIDATTQELCWQLATIGTSLRGATALVRAGSCLAVAPASARTRTSGRQVTRRLLSVQPSLDGSVEVAH